MTNTITPVGNSDESDSSGTRPPRSARGVGPEPGKGPRLIDVAHAAGVSPQTVSNVLGGRTGFTEETREKVVAAAANLNYSPNRAAQRLRSQRSHQIGLHLPAKWLSIREPFAISFLRAATEAAEAAGQQLVVFTTPLDEESVLGLVRSGVDGFILWNVGEDDLRPRVFTDLRIPFALMGRLEPGLPQNSVDIDNAGSMALIVDHLASKGHRTFAYIGYPSHFYADIERLAGTRARLKHHGIELAPALTFTATAENAAQVADQILDREELPDAIICASDALAAGVHAAMTRLHLRPGLEVALTGFDGLPLPFDLEPPLTTVQLPMAKATSEVMDLLLRRIAGEPAPTQAHIIAANLILGGTA